MTFLQSREVLVWTRQGSIKTYKEELTLEKEPTSQMLSSTTAGIVLKFPTVLFVDIANFHDQYFISICKRGEGGGAISMIYSTRVVVLPPGGQLDIASQWQGVDTGYIIYKFW